MIQSMTGFGRAEAGSANYKVSAELKSLNSKFLEINVKFPASYGEKELALRNHLNHQLKRGKVLVTLAVDVLNPEKAHLSINQATVKGYADELKNLASQLGLDGGISIEFLLSLPHAVNENDKGDDPEEWSLIESAVREATDNLIASRIREGAALELDLRTRCEMIMALLNEVQNQMGSRVDFIRNRMTQSLGEIRERTLLDENRFEQEILYYLEKLDINEEIVRLRKHLDYFEVTLREAESNGRRLNFIAQEMGREINTIGSKANDAAMQVCVVKMKEELEKIKEQLNNII